MESVLHSMEQRHLSPMPTSSLEVAASTAARALLSIAVDSFGPGTRQWRPASRAVFELATFTCLPRVLLDL
eukprot:COSAG02_NODE_908_length_16032_cov_53.699931_13_plen_71_part_00